MKACGTSTSTCMSNEAEQSIHHHHDITFGQLRFLVCVTWRCSYCYSDTQGGCWRSLDKGVDAHHWVKCYHLCSWVWKTRSNGEVYIWTEPSLSHCHKEFQYKCDDKWPKYKSLSLCLHRVTAAESNGELHSSWIGSEKHDQNKR